jgi:uncharacterized DUF497 family protein
MLFEWDPEKNKLNIKKHGVSFEQAVLVFTDRNALSIYDDEHSENEERWITIGCIPAEKVLVVIHTDRMYIDHKDVIRIISARKATDTEKEDYYRKG